MAIRSRCVISPSSAKKVEGREEGSALCPEGGGVEEGGLVPWIRWRCGRGRWVYGGYEGEGVRRGRGEGGEGGGGGGKGDGGSSGIW